MTVQELQHALATQPGTSDLDSDALIDGDILISVCLGIVVVEHDSGNTGLIHFTAKEYFLQHPIHGPLNVQETIARSCLTYLAFDGFAQGYCNNHKQLVDRLTKYPFGWYAATWWGVHLKNISDGELIAQTLEFLMDDRKVKAAGQLLYDFDDQSESIMSRRFTGLQLAARFGLLPLAKGILEKSVSIPLILHLLACLLQHVCKSYRASHELAQLYTIPRDKNDQTIFESFHDYSTFQQSSTFLSVQT